MSKRWMGIALLFVLFSVPAAHAAESSSSAASSFFQFVRDWLNGISAMIPPTGSENSPPPPPGGG
jgi:hypothetical protein